MAVSNKINSYSINSLTLGIFSILTPFIGLILGIIGIANSKKAKKEIIITNESGLAIATSGFICSIVGIIIQIFTIVSLILFTQYIR